jgi:nucleotide-binding universal stress UspA family protein
MTSTAPAGLRLQRHAGPRAGHVVCLMDDYDRSLPALREAVRIALAEGAGLTVVYEEAAARYLISREGGVWLAGTDELERCVRGLVGREIRAVRDARVEICWGYGVQEACRVARARDASVVVAPSCRRRVARILRGDVSRRLLRHAPCAVLPVAA